MSSRPLLSPKQVITDGSMTGTAVLTSLVTVIQNLTQIGYSVSWTGTAVGTFSVEVSNDYSIYANGAVRNAGTWTAVTLTGTPTAAGVAGTGYISLTDIPAYAIRLKYTNTSSTGTLQAYINAKVA